MEQSPQQLVAMPKIDSDAKSVASRLKVRKKQVAKDRQESKGKKRSNGGDSKAILKTMQDTIEYMQDHQDEVLRLNTLVRQRSHLGKLTSMSTTPHGRVQTSASTDASEASTTAASGSNAKSKALLIKLRRSKQQRMALTTLYGVGAAKKKLVEGQTEYTLEEVQQLIPPGARVYKQQPRNRWLITIMGTNRYRSWYAHGHFGSVQQILQYAWKLVLEHDGFEVLDCPTANIFKPRTGNKAEDDKLIAAYDLSVSL